MQIFGHSPLKTLKNQSPPRLKSQPSQETSQVDRFTATTDFEDAFEKDKNESLNLRKLSFLLASATPAVLGIANPASAAEVAQVAESKIDVNAEAPVDLAKSETLQPGTLIVSDFFDDHGGKSHGDVVEQSSRELGFKNSITLRKAPANDSTRTAERFYSRLDNRPFTPEKARQFTYDYIMHRQLGSLQSATQELDQLTQAGANNTVLNLSRGWGKAQIMESLYERTRMAWDKAAHPQSQTVGKRRVEKLAPALGVEAQDVLDGVGDARAKFQQGLLSLIDEASADERITEAQKTYDQAVHNFEARNNSVSVAAANSGRVLSLMQLDAPTPELAPDFFRNRLTNEETTTVGATRQFGGKEVVADYTNQDPGIDFYADGQIDGAWGTSFATPRTASLQAELHRQNPHATSDEVEKMMVDRFSHKLDDYCDWVEAPALNEQKAQEWLVGQ